MKYRVKQFRKQWDMLAKPEHKLQCNNTALHAVLFDTQCYTGKREYEMRGIEAKDNIPHILYF